MTIRRLLALFATASLLSCAVNPATGDRQLMLVSEGQEIAIGREGAEETLKAIPLVPDSGVQRYVRGVAMALVGVAERPNLPWAFHVLDDAAVNAFAYPGGFIFITRGILTHMNSEAELAGVLGHEIGHVTARHTASMISRAQLAQVGLVAGSIVSPTVAQFAGAASGGLGLLFLKYGRDAEYQADELGFRYMTRDQYDPRAMSSMFAMLQRQGALGGVGRLPEWQSTHPDPENRVERNDERVAAMAGDPEGLRRNREAFLRQLDGMVFGEDPRQGFFEAGAFLHPDLRFRLQFPDGWKTRNEPTAVTAMSQGQDAVAALSFASAASPAEGLRAFMGQQGVRAVSSSGGAVNGFPAATGEFVATTEQGQLQGVVQFVQYDGRLYRILGYTTPDRVRQYAAAFRTLTGSFDRLTDPAALNRQPVRIRLVRVDRSMTLEEFNRAFPSTIPIAQLAVINGVEPGASLRSGDWMKQVR